MTATAKTQGSSQLGRIKLKYVALFLIGLMGWSGLYAPEAISLILLFNLIALFLLNLARFKFLPKATQARGLSLVQQTPQNPGKVRAILICDGESPKSIIKTLKSLRSQCYPNLEIVALKVGGYDETYRALNNFWENREKDFQLFRREGTLDRGDAIATCLEFGSQEYRAALILAPGLKVSPHIINQAMISIETKQADYLQFFSTANRQSVLEQKRQRFFQTYMRAAPSCASPGIVGPMTLLRKDSIPAKASWGNESNPMLALSIALIKNGKRGFFEPAPCGSGATFQGMDLKQSIYEIKLGDVLQIGAPRFIPLLLQLTSHFHFITIPALYFGLSALDLLLKTNWAPKGDHSAFLAGSAILLSLYFKLALIYQKHCENLPVKSILKNFFTDLGSVFHGANTFSRVVLNSLLLTAIFMGIALYQADPNISYLTPILAAVLALMGIFTVIKDNHHFSNRSDSNLSPRNDRKRPSRKNKGVWRVEMNSSEA